MPKLKHVDASGFHDKWKAQYAVKVTGKENDRVSFVLCMFCACFGRDEEQDTNEDFGERTRERSRTPCSKLFKPGKNGKWRSDYFSAHHLSQHPVRWAAYKKMSMDEKRKLFIDKQLPPILDIRSFLHAEASAHARNVAGQAFDFDIDKDVIDALIGKLLFDVDTELDGDDDVREITKGMCYI